MNESMQAWIKYYINDNPENVKHESSVLRLYFHYLVDLNWLISINDIYYALKGLPHEVVDADLNPSKLGFCGMNFQDFLSEICNYPEKFHLDPLKVWWNPHFTFKIYNDELTQKIFAKDKNGK